ncbi:SKP1 component [Macrophomina phaseolina MS6]|uniref:Elongin-C n=1 Tax=Macrophomina phaseolina (strain MS6) TaxID=1126212 RepID=K2SRN5_MACPH|nr:SKP1 component [Macrophomina phaseolina MS6]
MPSSTGMTEYVTLVSRDGFEFKVLRSAANISGAIKRMLDPTNNFAEAKSNRCVFENINGVVLEKVCEYLYYNEKHKDAKDVPDMDIPPELCLELLMAADYLNAQFDYYATFN